MAPPIVTEPRPDGGLVQLKTRIAPETKREIAELALESGKTLCSIIDAALSDHVQRSRSRSRRGRHVLSRPATGRSQARRSHEVRGGGRRRSVAR